MPGYVVTTPYAIDGDDPDIVLEITQDMIDEARRHQVSGQDLMTLAWTIAVKQLYPDAYDIFFGDESGMGFSLPGEEG